MRRLWLWTS